MINFNSIPFEQIIKFGQRTMLNENVFNISWILGRYCNYFCSYCWPAANINKKDHLSLKLYKNTVDEIQNQAVRNGFNRFHWSFSGGEPTTYQNLLDLCQYISSKNLHSLHMTTNLSRSKNWWSKWVDSTSMYFRRSITASHHDEFANENEFADKILFLMEKGIFVTINQVMVPSKFDHLYEKSKRFYNKGINVTLKPQSDPSASFIVSGYDKHMIEIMRTGFPQKVNEKELYQISLFDNDLNEYFLDQAERFNAFNFNKFQGWFCRAGFQSVIIIGNEVKRGYGCKDDFLGTLNEGFKLFENPKICITPRCVSSADSKIPKTKIDKGILAIHED